MIMKRMLALLAAFMLLTLSALAEDTSGFPGVWIENDGFGTLTILADGTSHMEYYDGTVTECPWELTEEGAIFTEGQWFNSPMVLLDANTLSVADGWCIFTREGFLPTTDPALLLGAEPVGEEGASFLGGWMLTTLLLEGEELDPAILGMTMTLTFNADGTVVSDDGFEPYTTTWSVSYGNAVVEGDILTIDENDQLIFNSSDGMMVFARIAAEIPETDIFEIEVTNPEVPDIGTDDPAVIWQDIKAPETSFTPVGADGFPFLGTWSLEMIELDNMQMDPAMLGMTMVLTFNEDGSVISDDGFEPYTTPWYVEGGAAIVDGMALTLNDEGQLIMNDGEGMMIFTQGEAAPSGELTEEEQLLALLQLLGQMMETEESSGFDYLNTKFVCTSYSTSGVTLDGATLGAEFGVYFRDNGTADLILAGYTMENLPYTITDEGVYAVNYFGTFFNCTPTDTGFDMDYYGTMTMHCTPAE